MAKISSLDESAVQHVFTSPRALYTCHVTRCCSWIFTDAVDRFRKIPDAISSRRRQAFHHWKPMEKERERKREQKPRERERERTNYKARKRNTNIVHSIVRSMIRTNVKWSNEKQRRYVELTIERDVKLQQSNRSRNLLWFCVKTRSIASGSSGSMKNSQAFGSRWKGSSVGGVEREWIKRNYGILLYARVKLTRACGKYVHIGNRTNVVSSRLLRVNAQTAWRVEQPRISFKFCYTKNRIAR